MKILGATIPTLNLNERLFEGDSFVKTLTRGFWLAVTAFVLSLITLAVMLATMARTPAPIDVTAEFSRLKRVEFVAGNYVRLWLTSTEEQKAAMKKMVAADSVLPTIWASDPVQVSDVNAFLGDSITAEDGKTVQWKVNVTVTIASPGNDRATRNTFAVNVMDQPGTEIRAVTLPRPVNNVRPDISVALDYNHKVPAGGNSLATAVASFATAYYTDQTGSLPRWTTREFTSQPIVSSPWTSAELIAIKSHQPFQKDAKAGTTLDLVATIKLGISLTTFQVIDVPMHVQATENGWAVADLTDFVYYSGATEEK